MALFVYLNFYAEGYLKYARMQEIEGQHAYLKLKVSMLH